MNGQGARTLVSRNGLALIIVIGVLVLALFFILLIRPAAVSVASLDRTIEELELRQEKQRRLMPVYERLASRTPLEIPPALIIDGKTRFPREDIADIIPRFRELAGDAGVSVISVVPRLETMDETPGLLAVEMAVMGEYFAFRELLMAMARLSYMGGIESVSVRRPEAGGANKHITLKMWVLTTQ